MEWPTLLKEIVLMSCETLMINTTKIALVVTIAIATTIMTTITNRILMMIANKKESTQN